MQFDYCQINQNNNNTKIRNKLIKMRLNILYY